MANKRVNDDGSMKAVIYARYSSENQREESIEGQIRECYAFARKNNISVICEPRTSFGLGSAICETLISLVLKSADSLSMFS